MSESRRKSVRKAATRRRRMEQAVAVRALRQLRGDEAPVWDVLADKLSNGYMTLGVYKELQTYLSETVTP